MFILHVLLYYLFLTFYFFLFFLIWGVGGSAWFYHRIMCLKDADRKEDCVDPDQQSDLGLHFVQINHCLYENLGSLWY